jgi:molecular chaperone DnaK (HSP70)
LGLCPEVHSESELAKNYPSQTGYDPVEGKTCERLVVDFLRSLRERADEFFQTTLADIVLESTPREYIITVPAIWTDKAQKTTRECAEEAGMGLWGHVHITSEPEAAGIWALEDMRSHGAQFNKGDAFVICDAGGG